MSVQSVVRNNILNRSPWQVIVRSRPQQDRQFAFNKKTAAEGYMADLSAQGIRAKLIQLETSFQLRLRRQGVKVQFLTFSTYVEAEQARLKIESDLSVSIIKDYAVATHTTLRELMTRYREVTYQHKGGDVERNRINRICRDEAFVDKKLAALTTEDLQDFIDDRLTQVAPSTVDRDLDVISQTLNYAKNVWKISPVESPFAGLQRPKYFNERDRRLSGDDELRLLAAARADENPYVEPAIILALETAARRGELLSLTVADINLDERYALLRETKNGRSRKVPLTTRAMEVCTALMMDCDSEDEVLLKLTANALKIAFFRRVVPASGVQDIHFHDLRHESISRFAESGIFQMIELQAISGHRDTRMLLRYAHLCSGNLAKKMDNAVVERTTRQYAHRGRMRQSVSVQELQMAAPKVSAATPTPSNVISFANARGEAALKARAIHC